jgi:hypothetical protein
MVCKKRFKIGLVYLQKGKQIIQTDNSMGPIAELLVGSWIGNVEGLQVNATFRANEMVRFMQDDGLWEIIIKEGIPFMKLTFIGPDGHTPFTTLNRFSLAQDGSTLSIEGEKKPLLLVRENPPVSPDITAHTNGELHYSPAKSIRDSPYLAQKNLPILTGTTLIYRITRS